MSGYANAMAVLFFQQLPKFQERLDIAPASNDHDDNVQPGLRRGLTGDRYACHGRDAVFQDGPGDWPYGVDRHHFSRIALDFRRLPDGSEVLVKGGAERFGKVSSIASLVETDV